MKHKRILNTGIALALTAVLVWSVLGMLKLREEDTYYHVSVILNDSYNESWTLVRNGMEQAAKDNNIILNYLYTNSMESLDEQLELIHREEENGAEGIITKLLPVEDKEKIEELAGEKNLILMDSMLSAGSDEQPDIDFVGPDYYDMGKSLAHRVYSDCMDKATGELPEEELKEQRIGLILSKNEVTSQLKKQGFMRIASGMGLNVCWVLEADSTESDSQKLVDQINDKKQVDILVTLENNLSERVLDYVALPGAKSAKAGLYDIGFSEKLLYYLDKGKISALVVPNEFNLGYQSVQAMADKLTAKQQSALSNQIRYTLVDKTTLYDEDNQRMLFPIVQ